MFSNHLSLLVGLMFLLSSNEIMAQDKKQPVSFAQEELIAKQFEKWKAGTASFFDLLDDNVNWVVSGRSPVSGTYHGKREFLEKAVNPILSQLKTPLSPELISVSSDGNFVWLHFRATATTIDNNTYENSYVWKIEMANGKIIAATAFLDTYELSLLLKKQNTMSKNIEETKEYIGMWVTKDGHVRHNLLPNNRYDEARGNKESAYQGSYWVKGNHIDYKDDTGFTADGEFKDGILYHGGMILYKEND